MSAECASHFLSVNSNSYKIDNRNIKLDLNEQHSSTHTHTRTCSGQRFLCSSECTAVRRKWAILLFVCECVCTEEILRQQIQFGLDLEWRVRTTQRQMVHRVASTGLTATVVPSYQFVCWPPFGCRRKSLRKCVLRTGEAQMERLTKCHLCNYQNKWDTTKQMWPHIYTNSTSDSMNRKNRRDWASGSVAKRLQEGRNQHQEMERRLYGTII